jgi:hypothetical protein
MSTPVITSVNPSSARVGDEITITGTNFGPSSTLATVTLNSVICPILVWSDTQIVCKIPHTTSGDLVVTANDNILFSSNNLLSDEDTSFEGGTTGNFIDWWGKCTLVNSVAEAFDGTHSIKQTNTHDLDAQCQGYPPALANGLYTVSVKFKGVVGKNYRLDLDGGGYSYGTPVTATGGWDTCACTVNVTTGALGIYPTQMATGSTGLVVYWDAFLLESGPTATPFGGSGISGGYPFTVIDTAMLRFVDKTYSITGGDAGDVLLDITDGTDYCVDEVEFPTPRPRIEFRDPAHSDGRETSFFKHENRIITIHMHVFGSDESDLSENIRILFKQIYEDNGILEWRPGGWANGFFFDLIAPPIEINTPQWFVTWIRENNQLCVLAELELVLEAKSLARGPREYLDIMENLAPNASFGNWTSGGSPLTDTIDDWTIFIGGASEVNQEAGTIFDGSYSVEMIRSGGNCQIGTTGYITIDIDDPYYLDGFVYSTAALSFSLKALCYDSADNYLGSVDFIGNTRGASEFDRETMYLYHVGTVTSYYIAAADWPALTDKIKIFALLNDDGTVYLDSLTFANVKYISDYAVDGVVGLRIQGEDIKGDLPALCDFYISNPFTSPPWKEQESGETVDINGVHALDATHGYAVGDEGYIFFYNGLLWATQSSGVSVPLNGVSAFDDSNIWAVGDNGAIRFFGAPWTGQTYPASTPSVTDQALDIWTNSTTLTNWTKNVISGALVKNVDFTPDFRAAFYSYSGEYLNVLIDSNTKAAINISDIYAVSVMVDVFDLHNRGTCKISLAVVFYDAGGNYLGSKGEWFDPWTIQRTIWIHPWDYPAGTTQIALHAHGLGQPIGEFGIILNDFGISRVDVPDLYGVHAISATNIVAVGQYGCIIESENGTTWARRTSGTSNNLNAVHYEAGTPRWYAVGDNGTILTSPDGNTWTIRVSGTTKDLYGVYALDATHIWAVGEDGIILFSADAGISWIPQTSGTAEDLKSVYAADATHVWAVGDNGIIGYFNGAIWTLQSSGTGENLYGISGLSATSVWACGGMGTILYGIYSGGALAITDLILGQRDAYSDSYNPVVECTTGTLEYDPYRRWGTYRAMDASDVNDFLFNLASHSSDRYMPTAGLTFTASTAFDKGHIHKFLETTAGTDITTQYQTDEIDLADPIGEWREVALQIDRWDNINVATHVVSDDASLGNINQVLELIVDPSLDGSPTTYMLVDYMALIPTDHFVRVATITANYLIIDSTMGYVLDSLDGGPSTAQAHAPSEVIGAPDFLADPMGMNLTLVAINEVLDGPGGDQRVGWVNLTMSYDPLYLLVVEE